MAHNIVLKNSQGNNVTYKNVSKVNLLDTNGNTVVFSEPKTAQTKTINPTTSEQSVTPDNGYELTEVKVGAIQTEEMSATENGEYTPSDGKYISKFTVNVASSGGGADSSSKLKTLANYCSIRTVYYNNTSYAPSYTLDYTDNIYAVLDDNFDASGATSIDSMFLGNTKLTVLPKLNSVNATNANAAFSGCKNLTTVQQIDTGKVTNMASMFRYCSALTTIPQMDTSQVSDMSYIFSDCTNLTTIPLMNTSKVTNMNYMVQNCTNLTTIPLLDTSNVVSMGYMFYGCTNLTEIPLLNTSKVTGMGSMFASCKKLTSVSFTDTSKVTNVTAMFNNCTSLITIDNLNLIAVTSALTNVFGSCTNLTNLTLKNIKKTGFTIGSGTTYGHLLTIDSLVNTIKELWDYSSGTTTYKITMGTANTEKLANVYVKLITATDEMIAADPNINSKMPCEVCESTDEGAMLITDYATAKGWTIS